MNPDDDRPYFNLVFTFLRTCTVDQRHYKQHGGELHAAFCIWARAQGIDPPGRAMFTRIVKRAYPAQRSGTNRTTRFQGLALKPEYLPYV